MKEKAQETERENESKWEKEEKEGERNTSGKKAGGRFDIVEQES